MANFSIRLARRNVKGIIVPGEFVDFETDKAEELEEFYNKVVVGCRPGKRHTEVLAKQTKKKKARRVKTNDAQLSSSGAG